MAEIFAKSSIAAGFRKNIFHFPEPIARQRL